LESFAFFIFPFLALQYGQFSIKNNQGVWRGFPAHRVSFVIIGVALDINLVVDHKCRNRNCVNPKHLRQVTPRQNVTKNSMSFVAVNLVKKYCPKGHPYSAKNTGRSKQGFRYCKLCKKIKIALWRARNK